MEFLYAFENSVVSPEQLHIFIIKHIKLEMDYACESKFDTVKPTSAHNIKLKLKYIGVFIYWNQDIIYEVRCNTGLYILTTLASLTLLAQERFLNVTSVKMLLLWLKIE